jgi:ribosomal protein S18 acetylase RimI-like enzyme
MIRQFQEEDAAACSELIRACLEMDASISPSLQAKLLDAETPGSIIARSRLFYVAVFESEEKQILGLAGLDLNEIKLLCVSPEHQRKGIGKALYSHIQNFVPAAIFSDIFVYASVQAIGFYKSLGFLEKGAVSFDISGEHFPAIFMTHFRH